MFPVFISLGDQRRIFTPRHHGAQRLHSGRVRAPSLRRAHRQRAAVLSGLPPTHFSSIASLQEMQAAPQCSLRRIFF
jgi:hypothetical protein